MTHLAATLLVIGAVFLMADFIWRRFPVHHWRLACAIALACMTGFDIVVVQLERLHKLTVWECFLLSPHFARRLPP